MKLTNRTLLTLAAMIAAAGITMTPSGSVSADNASPTLLNNVIASLEPTSATPFGRVVNNTIVGSADAVDRAESGLPVVGDWDGDGTDR